MPPESLEPEDSVAPVSVAPVSVAPVSVAESVSGVVVVPVPSESAVYRALVRKY